MGEKITSNRHCIRLILLSLHNQWSFVESDRPYRQKTPVLPGSSFIVVLCDGGANFSAKKVCCWGNADFAGYNAIKSLKQPKFVVFYILPN